MKYKLGPVRPPVGSATGRITEGGISATTAAKPLDTPHKIEAPSPARGDRFYDIETRMSTPGTDSKLQSRIATHNRDRQ